MSTHDLRSYALSKAIEFVSGQVTTDEAVVHIAAVFEKYLEHGYEVPEPRRTFNDLRS